MAVIEITCPHCSARTYVTFVRQTGNGSCPECGNEIENVFRYSSNPTSGVGTLLTDDFSPGGATLVPGADASGDGQDLYGDQPPASLPLLDPSSAPSLMPRQSAPSLELSTSGPSLMPFERGQSEEPSESGPLLVPTESAPMLVPSTSAPTLIPSNSSASARVEGVLLTPPPPRLRQFATEDSASTRSKRPTAEINLEEQPAVEPLEDSPTRPTLPPVPVSMPQRSSQTRAAERRPTGSIAAAPQAASDGAPAPLVVAKAATGRVQKLPTGPVAKPATGSIAKAPAAPRKPTASIAQTPPKSLLSATRRPTSPLPSREVTRPVAAPAPMRRPTGSINQAAAQGDALAPAEELSLFTPPPPKAPTGTRAAMPPGPKRPTAPVAKAAPGTRAVPQSSADSGGRSYAPIRVPGGPPSPVSSPRPPASPPRTPTRKLNLVGLGEAPRLESSEKPKNFAKPKFDPGLTRLGYTMPGSDVSHFDGLPEPSPVPFGATLPDGDEQDAPPPVAPGPKPGTRAAMPRPSAPIPKPPKAPEEDYDDLAEQQGIDAPAARVSKADINEDWAPSGPDSGVIGNVEIPGDFDDESDGSAATTVPGGENTGDDEELDDEFEAEAETRPLLKQEKPERKKPRPTADEGPKRVYMSAPRFDWEKFRYHLFVGTIYTVCALALAAFVLGLVHVHVQPLF